MAGVGLLLLRTAIGLVTAWQGARLLATADSAWLQSGVGLTAIVLVASLALSPVVMYRVIANISGSSALHFSLPGRILAAAALSLAWSTAVLVVLAHVHMAIGGSH